MNRWLRRDPRLTPRLLALVALLTAIPACAYGPATAKRMTEVNLRLAPVALRSALLSCREQLDRGVRETLDSSSSATKSQVVDAAAKECELIPALARNLTPFEEIAFHFGNVAALVYLANDPLMDVQDPRATAVRADYDRYMERKLPLMVVAFDGYGSPPLGTDLRAYLGKRIYGEDRYLEAILFCYYPKGKLASSDTFDDRSNAFGTAQLILSHAVSDAAKVWFSLWSSMKGDLAATPFYRPGETSAPQEPGEKPTAESGEDKKR